MKNKLIIFFLLLSVNSFSQIIRTLPYVNNTADTLKPISNAQKAAINQKVHITSSISALQAFTDANLAYLDGSLWERKSGNVASNGGVYAGTIINVSSLFYWERKFENRVIVKWFGAVGDGATDNTTAIINGNNYCVSIGKVLFFPIGIWNTAGISVPANTKFEGESKTQTILKLTGIPSDNSLLRIVNKSGLSIVNMTLDGNNAVGQTILAYATSLDMSDFLFDNLILKNQGENLHFVGEGIYKIKNVKVSNCYFANASNINIENRGVVGLNIENSTFANWAIIGLNSSQNNFTPSIAFYSTCSNVRIDKCDFLNNYSTEFAIEAPLEPIDHIAITNCNFNGGGATLGGTGISGNFNYATFDNNKHFNNNGVLSYELFGSIGNVILSNTTIEDGQISIVKGSNYILNNVNSTVSGKLTDNNISIASASNITINNCKLNNTTGNNDTYCVYVGYYGNPNFANNVKINNCTITSASAKTGIRVHGVGFSISDISITNNVFIGGNGVDYVNSGSLNCELSNNDFSKVTTGYTSSFTLTPEFKLINNTYSSNKNSLSLGQNFNILSGLTSPNSSIYSGIGSIFSESTNGLLYIKTTNNTLNTGWNLLPNISDLLLKANLASPTFTGTTSMSGLEVSGSPKFIGATTFGNLVQGAGGLTIDANSGAGVTKTIQTYASSPLSLNPSGSNVLIGTTTNGSYLLDVNGTSRTKGVATFGPNSTGFAGLQIDATQADGTAKTIQSYGSSPLALNSLAGNVLIGTNTNSSYKLDVLGNGRFTSALSVGGVFTNSNITIDGTTATGVAKTIQSYDSSPLAFNALGNNVLIGTTTNNSYKLDVNGTVRSTGNAYFGSQVGIGTLTPLGTLQVGAYNVNTSANDVVLFAPSNGVGTGNSIKFDMNVGGGVARSRLAEIQSLAYQNAGVNQLRFNLGVWNNNAVTSTVMSLQDDGKVGIGTTSPITPLDVVGGINTNNTYYLGGTQFAVNTGLGSTSINTRIINNSNSTGASADGMYIGYSNAGGGATRIYDGSTSNYMNVNASVFSTTNINKFLFGNQTDDGTANQFSGNVNFKANVGIGTSSPLAKLDIRGNTHVSDGVGTKIRLRTGGIIDFTDFAETGYAVGSFSASRFSFTGGNVGINSTIAPISTLQVNGTLSVGTGVNASDIGMMQLVTGGASPFVNKMTYGTDGSGYKFAISKNQAGTVTDQIVIQDNGNVGIGVGAISPLAKLHLYDAGAGDFLKLQTGIVNGGNWLINPFIASVSNGGLSFVNKTTSTTPFVISANDYIGIGTTTPTQLLELASTTATAALKISASLATTNSSIQLYNDALSLSQFSTRGSTSASNFASPLGNGSTELSTTSATGLLVGTRSATPIVIGTNNVEVARILSNGNTGFGTTTPVAKVDIYGTAGLLPITGSTQTVANLALTNLVSYSTTYLGTNSTYPYAGWIQNAGRNDLSSTYPMSLQPNGGSVGIGTTTPNALHKLDVNGNINTNGSLYLNNVGFASSSGNNSNSVSARVIANSSGTGGSADGMYIGYSNSGGAMTRIFDGTVSNYVGIGSSTFSTANINKFLFGNQTDDGTFAQFSGDVKVKGVLRLNSDITLPYNGFHYWTDAIGSSRRMLGLSGLNFYVGDVDNAIGGSNVMYKAGFSHIFYLNGIEKARIAQSGYMGIGTTNPYSKLQISGYDQSEGITLGDRPDNANTISSSIYTTNIGNGILNIQTSKSTIGGGITAIQPDGGSVGIGTRSPIAALDVSGNINLTGSLLLNGSGFAYWDGTYNRIQKRNGGGILTFNNTSTYYDNDLHIFRYSNGTELVRMDGLNSVFQTTTNRNLFGTQTDDGTANQFAGDIRLKGILRLNSDITLKQGAFLDWADNATGNNRRMLGLSGLNFYIGDVDNSIVSSANIFAANYAHVFLVNNVEKLRITQGGSVGVGTNTPLYKLHIKGVSNFGIKSEAPSSDAGIYLGHSGSVADIASSYESVAGFTPLTLTTGGTERVRITQGGSVGVGSAAPTSKFQVVGSEASTFTSISIATTLSEHRYIVVTAGVLLTLPTASTCSGRTYTINSRAAGVTSSAFNNLSGTSITTFTSGTSVTIISDGTSWQQVQ